eukprot:15924-Chlamydomonas_euryale.AAC.2
MWGGGSVHPPHSGKPSEAGAASKARTVAATRCRCGVHTLHTVASPSRAGRRIRFKSKGWSLTPLNEIMSSLRHGAGAF